jgi:hypothetical protein
VPVIGFGSFASHFQQLSVRSDTLESGRMKQETSAPMRKSEERRGRGETGSSLDCILRISKALYLKKFASDWVVIDASSIYPLNEL